ncbi:MAG: ATP-binding protein [bacterium]
MLKKFRITTKLFITVGVILITLIGLTGYIVKESETGNYIRLNEESAHLISEVIMHNLTQFMRTRDLHNMENVIELLVKEQPDIEKIRLINEDGEIILSSDEREAGKTLKKNSRMCSQCHKGTTPVSIAPEEDFRSVTTSMHGHKVLTVVTPIYNAESCFTSKCHYHPEDQKVLGVIQTDYSLASMEKGVVNLRRGTLAAAAAAIAITIFVLWVFINRYIAIPVRGLLQGMRRVAAGDLDYRYPVVIKDEVGHIGAVFNRMVDQLEAKTGDLRRTRDHLAGIIESSGDIITSVSGDGLIESFNTAGEKTLGYDRSEVIGQKAEMLFSSPEDYEAILHQLREGNGIVKRETSFCRKNGALVDIILTASRLKDPDGSVRGTICMGTDITEYKELQKKVIQSERLAAIGTTVASLSHNAKNILNNLKGGSYMMRLGFHKEKMSLLKEGWSVMELGISKLSDMAMDMLNFTRDKKLNFMAAPVNDVVGEVCDLVVLYAENSGIELSWELGTDIPPVRIDSEAIHTAVLNLANNAVEACTGKEYGPGEQPQIDIRTYYEADGGHVVIQVADNGDGISDEIKDKVFKPFFTTKYKKGTGLGLAITAKTIQEHGGSIEVDSREGEGATFTIKLPLA